MILGLRWGAHRVCVQATFLGDGKNWNDMKIMSWFALEKGATCY